MKTFGWRAVSVALIIVFSDALGEAMIKGNRAKFLSYSSPPTNFTYETVNQFYEIYNDKNCRSLKLYKSSQPNQKQE